MKESRSTTVKQTADELEICRKKSK